MKTEKKRLKPLLPNELTVKHFENGSLGHWIDRYFPDAKENYEAREIFFQAAGGTIHDWEEADHWPDRTCALWHELVTMEVETCTSMN